MQNYFTITPQTTTVDLEAQYKELAKLHHPDKFAHLGEDEEQQAKEKFQAIQQQYEAEMLKLKFPEIKIVESKLYQGIRAGADEMLRNMGYKPIAELFPEKINEFIDKIKLPPALEKHKGIAKMIVATQLGDPDTVVSFIEDLINNYKKSKRK